MPRRLLLTGFVFLTLFSTCSAQFRPCKFADVSTVDHVDGVTVLRLNIVEPAGTVGASAFIPAGDRKVPAALFSHSAIHGPEANADLRRFAWALGRSGVAVIVLDGTVEWLAPNNNSVRDPHLMACAGQWLMLNAKLDNQRRLLVGTHGSWGGGDTPLCQPGEQPCYQPQSEIGLGQIGAAENTDGLLAGWGLRGMANFAQRHLQLSGIDPQLLAGVVESPIKQ